MNIRKIKLALTVGLLNLGPTTNILQLVRELLADIQETGAYLGQKKLDMAKVSRLGTKETYALQYEHCTIALEVVSNQVHPQQSVHGFKLMR
jgi:hypothetical protein